MTYDPFLDPPRQSGCLLALAAVPALAVIIAAGLRWGVGDAIAAAAWLAFFALIGRLAVLDHRRHTRTARHPAAYHTHSHVRVLRDEEQNS